MECQYESTSFYTCGLFNFRISKFELRVKHFVVQCVPVIAVKNTNAFPTDFIFSTYSANMIYRRFIRRSPVCVSGYQQKSLLNP